MELIRLLLKIVIVLKTCVDVSVNSQDIIVNPYVVRSPFTLLPEDKHESKDSQTQTGPAGNHLGSAQDVVTPYTNGQEDYSVKPIQIGRAHV